jgi:hypothetical protein
VSETRELEPIKIEGIVHRSFGAAGFAIRFIPCLALWAPHGWYPCPPDEPVTCIRCIAYEEPP